MYPHGLETSICNLYLGISVIELPMAILRHCGFTPEATTLTPEAMCFLNPHRRRGIVCILDYVRGVTFQTVCVCVAETETGTESGTESGGANL